MHTRASGSKVFLRQVASAACLLFFIGSGVVPLGAQDKIYRPPPNYAQFGKPDQAEGRRILEDFRGRGISGDYYLEFQLRSMPRRGAERIVPGAMWGSRNRTGPVSRVVLTPEGAPEQRLLVQNGPRNALWRWQSGSGTAAASLGLDALFEPLAGTDLTPFDLQMPFIFWDDFVYEGLARVRGRPAHVFLLYPPKDVTALRPQLTGVRMYVDTQFNALVQAEQIGPNNRAIKAISILDLKKVGEQWIVKSIDVRNEETRNKTRFQVTAAALGLDLSSVMFTPGLLNEAVEAPSPPQLKQL